MVASLQQTAAQALALVRSGLESPSPFIAVCADERIVGLVELAVLLRSEPTVTLGELAKPPAAVVTGGTSAERAAWLAAQGGAEVVVVNDETGRFVGLVPAHRLMGVMVHEHEVDLARLGGFLRGASRARTASEEQILRRIWHRVPWLLVGLMGAVIAAQVVHSFEAELAETLALAFFLPSIVYMADAVGTQTETLVIRGLSVGVPVRRILRLEVLTGAIVGLLLSIAIFPFALVITGETQVAAIVAASLFAATSVATIVAMSLPWLLDKLNFDPAFGSGPLATVVQDLLSILIYFGFAAALLG